METDPQKKIPFLERLGGSLDGMRSWVSAAWRMGSMMAKGAYLLGERKALLYKLGQEVYKHCHSGEIQHASIDPIIHQLDRLNKKVEIEETLIENLRYGVKHGRKGPRSAQGDPHSETVSS
jgi:hypothetical protein